MNQLPLLLQVLRAPARVAALDAAQWSLLLRQSDSANLSAALFYLVDDLRAKDEPVNLPEPVADRLDWSRVAAERHRTAARWEVDRIALALVDKDVPLILLKGAAYTMSGLPCGLGRLYSDIDILVPRDRIDEVEVALMTHGWRIEGYDAYDQRYYRQWMHELPPMTHVRRDTTIDVHHAILPLTARAHPDPDKLRAAAVAIGDGSGLYTLAPVDMVLHSAVHLFFSEEFHHGLRDLVDIHRLLEHYGGAPAFWPALTVRAAELGVERPLHYALRYGQRLLGTAIPPEMTAVRGPAAPVRWWMDWLFERALLPDHASCRRPGDALARLLLYVRGHWLRMPFWMLVRHLTHKLLISSRKETDKREGQ